MSTIPPPPPPPPSFPSEDPQKQIDSFLLECEMGEFVYDFGELCQAVPMIHPGSLLRFAMKPQLLGEYATILNAKHSETVTKFSLRWKSTSERRRLLATMVAASHLHGAQLTLMKEVESLKEAEKSVQVHRKEVATCYDILKRAREGIFDEESLSPPAAKDQKKEPNTAVAFSAASLRAKACDRLLSITGPSLVSTLYPGTWYLVTSVHMNTISVRPVDRDLGVDTIHMHVDSKAWAGIDTLPMHGTASALH